MGFGTNPYVGKAQAAARKADDAGDDLARAAAHREAAHLWERAAKREKPGKRRDEYDAHAARHRALAEDHGEPAPASAKGPTLLN